MDRMLSTTWSVFSKHCHNYSKTRFQVKLYIWLSFFAQLQWLEKWIDIVCLFDMFLTKGIFRERRSIRLNDAMLLIRISNISVFFNLTLYFRLESTFLCDNLVKHAGKIALLNGFCEFCIFNIVHSIPKTFGENYYLWIQTFVANFNLDQTLSLQICPCFIL
jgi:hypothetical protein